MVRQFIFVLAGAACAGTASADMVYGQRPGTIEGFWLSGTPGAAAIADDFALSTTTLIQSVDFWTLFVDPGQVYTLGFWRDEGGGNGVDDSGLIHTQSFTVGQVTETNDAGMTKLTAVFTSPFALAPGTYWLSIGVSDAFNHYWATQGTFGPDPLGTAAIDFDQNGDNIWEGPANVHPWEGLAFDINGEPQDSVVVPLPAAPALGLAGLSGVALIKVRRHQRCRCR